MNAGGADPAAAKAAARASALAARRDAFARSEGAAAAAHLRAALADEGDKILAGYMPMRSEIDPLPAMAAHRGPVCVPVVVRPGQPLRFRAWQPGCAMQVGAFGAQVPLAGAWMRPEVVIVPLVAFDAEGYRLGYGGGFYDRTLAFLRAAGAVRAIGFAFAAQQQDRVPREPTDEPLDLIVTEAGPVVPAR